MQFLFKYQQPTPIRAKMESWIWPLLFHSILFCSSVGRGSWWYASNHRLRAGGCLALNSAEILQYLFFFQYLPSPPLAATTHSDIPPLSPLTYDIVGRSIRGSAGKEPWPLQRWMQCLSGLVCLWQRSEVAQRLTLAKLMLNRMKTNAIGSLLPGGEQPILNYIKWEMAIPSIWGCTNEAGLRL